VKLPRIDPGTHRLATQRLNHYAIPGPRENIIVQKFKILYFLSNKRRHKKNVHRVLVGNHERRITPKRPGLTKKDYFIKDPEGRVPAGCRA
jgi:hypothetical protein